MNRKILAIPALFPLLLSCGGSAKEEKVLYASFYPIYDLCKRVVGNAYEVVNLTKPGTEPHDYEINNRDMAGMSASKAIFLNGLGLEAWGNSLPSSLSQKAYVVSKGIETLSINGVEDPHVWLNPLNAIKEMENILLTMKEIDKENASLFQSNFDANKALLLQLDEDLCAQRKEFDNTYFAVSHAAFGYLADRYELHQIYVSGLSPEEEPTAKDMERIASAIKEHGISTIFTEELASPEIAEAIARETGAKLDVLNPLEGLSEEESKTEDYISVMRTNFRKLKEASL